MPYHLLHPDALHSMLGAVTEQGDIGPLDLAMWGLLVALVAAALFVSMRDLARISPTRLWALAAQTVRESVRRRVLLLIPGAMLLIVAIGLFQRGFDEVGHVHQAIETSIRVTAALTMLLMIELSAFAFPREYETRTIYSLITKPVSRLEIFLGKLIGLWVVAGIVLVLMGAFSYLYLHMQAGTLTSRAIDRLDSQQQAYEQYLVSTGLGTTTQPADMLASDAVRVDPPSDALRQQLDMGLLRAANYVDSPRVDLHPVVPAGYRNRNRKWIITRRGYVGQYVFSLPPLEAREHSYQLAAVMDIPAAGQGDVLEMNLRFHLPEPVGGNVKLWNPPAALRRSGWPVGVGDPVGMPLKHFRDNLFLGTTMISAEFLKALGPIRQLGISVELLTSQPQMVGLLPVGSPPPGMLLTPVDRQGQAAGPDLLPEQLLVLPRSNATMRFTLSGTEPGGIEEVAEYSFDDLSAATLQDGDLVFRLMFRVDKGTPIGIDSQAMVVARGGGLVHESLVTPATNLASYIRVPRQLARDGRVVLLIRPLHAEDSFTLSADSVRLVCQPTSFAANLFKSLLIIGLAAMVIVGVGVMASVFLSWPVALLLTSVVLVAGNLLDLVRGMARGDGQIFQITGEDRSYDLLGSLGNTFFGHTAQLVIRIVPDFTRFDPIAFIGQGMNIPWAEIGGDVLLAAKYLGVAMAIGVLALHYREVAR